jgi:hypothetical protein
VRVEENSPILPMLEWMVSVDARTAGVTEEQAELVMEELERIVWDPPLGSSDDTLGSTFTVYAPSADAAELRGRHLFEAALRLAGVPGDVILVSACEYEDVEE